MLKERGDIEPLRRAQRSSRAHMNAADIIPKVMMNSSSALRDFITFINPRPCVSY